MGTLFSDTPICSNLLWGSPGSLWIVMDRYGSLWTVTLLLQTETQIILFQITRTFFQMCSKNFNSFQIFLSRKNRQFMTIPLTEPKKGVRRNGICKVCPLKVLQRWKKSISQWWSQSLCRRISHPFRMAWKNWSPTPSGTWICWHYTLTKVSDDIFVVFTLFFYISMMNKHE